MRTFMRRGIFLILVIFWHVQFLCLWNMMVESSLCFCNPSPSAPPKVPMPTDDEDDIEDVECDHDSALPDLQSPIYQEHHAEASCHYEETNITNKAFPGDSEGFDQGHTSGNDSRYEARSTK